MERAKVWGVIGLVAHVAVGVFLYLPLGLLAPGWAIVLLNAVWAALLVTAIRIYRLAPAKVLLMPAIAIAVWFVTLQVGERFLGWSA